MDEEGVRQKMQSAVQMVREDVGTIRTGRATPALVEDIVIEVYEGQQRLRLIELAAISAPDARTLVIAPWDKSIIGEVKRGIEKADIGLVPVYAGEVLRINLPPLTEEDREGYIRLLHQKLEAGRILVRQARQDGMQKIRQALEEKEISEDEKFREEKRLQEITDEHIAKIDETGKRKETELKSV